MMLQDLPARLIPRLLKSVTWTDVNAAYTARNSLRAMAHRVAHSTSRVLNSRKADFWLEIRRAIARVF
jgi:hypothetical protein